MNDGPEKSNPELMIEAGILGARLVALYTQSAVGEILSLPTKLLARIDQWSEPDPSELPGARRGDNFPW